MAANREADPPTVSPPAGGAPPPAPQPRDDFLRQICQATRVGLWTYRYHGDTVLWTNDPELIGAGRQALADPRFTAHTYLLHPDDRDALCANIDGACRQPDRAILHQHRILFAGGAVRWLEVHAEMESDPGGRPLQLRGYAIDITERKRSETALRRVLEIGTLTGDQFFQALVRILAESLEVRCAYVCTLLDGRPYRGRTIAVWFNGALAQGWEYSLTGTPCEKVIEAESSIFIPASLRSLFPNNDYIRKRGYDSYAGVPLIGAQGQAIGHLVVVHDGPMDAHLQPELVMKVVAQRVAGELERALAENSARQTRLQFDNLIANTPNVAIQTFDADGRVLSWNQASADLYGVSAAAAIGRPLVDLAGSPDEAAAFQAAFQRSLAGEPSTGPREGVIRRPNGEEAWALSTVFALHAPGDAPVIARLDIDITERVRLLAELHQAQKLDSIGRLAGGIAHDFNNLLTSIIGHTELARRTLVDAPARRHLDVIALAARQGAELTGQMLAFARRQPILPRNVELNAALADADRLLRRLLGEPIELCLQPDPANPIARVDPGQLTQIIINLAVNARDAMPRGGRLTLQSGLADLTPGQAEIPADLPAGRYALLAVTDTGEGICAEHRRRLFEPFFTTKPTGQGTGLGLSTCYGIVKQHRGHLAVESEPGRGTTFRLYLPAGDGPAAAQPQPLPPDQRPCTETIWVCEDDPLLLDLAHEIIGRLGYHVIAANCGRELVAKLAADPTQRLDLLLTDLVMSDMSGPELAQELKKHRPHLPVLYVSGYTEMTAFQTRPLDAGARFLQKPFSIGDLTRTLREILHPSTA